MNTHKHHARKLSPHDKRQLEAQDELLAAQAYRRMEQRAWWDENRPDGEGETKEGTLYQWVRITGFKERVLGTFYLQQEDGKLVRLFLITPPEGPGT